MTAEDGAPAQRPAQTKVARLAAIRSLLETRRITSQSQLRSELASMGFVTVQATLSRDLGELGAHKVREGSQTVYRVASDPHAVGGADQASARLAKWCQQLLVGADCAQNLLVLRTPAGAANMLGSAVDTAGLPQVLGTVAGDDTVLTVCPNAEMAAELRDLLLTYSQRA